MARTDNLKNYLADVADAIREKTNTTDKIKASEFDDKIRGISGGSEQWEWALNNVINFGSANPTFFKGNTYLKVMPNYLEDKCLEITNWSGAFSECTNLTEANINTSNGTNFSKIFYNCSKLINVINTGDFSKGLDFTNAFRNTRVTDDAVQKFSFDSITNGSAMFGYGTKITQLPKFNHETITNMGEMFWQCSLSDLGTDDLNFPNVTNAEWIFGETQVVKAPNLSFPNATSAKGIFRDCLNLTSVANFNIPNATNVAEAFKGCTNLTTIGVLSIPKMRTFNNLFYNCKTLESIEQFNVSSATNLASLFARSNNLKSVDFVNSTSKVTNFSGLFAGKTVLETVKGLDLSSATNLASMFASCSNLKNITFVENSIKINFNLGSSSLLSDESIQSLINGLATVKTAQKLTIHNDVATKLTNEQKATISSKNWNIVIPQGGEVKTELEVTDANTLIATIYGRQFTKTNDGLAIACTVTFDSYTGILLVSEVKEAVTYSALGRNFTSAGSFTYDDKNYYYSSREYFMGGHTIISDYPKLNDISGKTYTNDNNGSEEASTDLLNYYFNK